MNDPMLADQVRTLVDVVEPVTANEVTGRRATTRERRSIGGVLVAVAVTVLIAAVALGAVALTRDGDGSRHVAARPADGAGPTTEQPADAAEPTTTVPANGADPAAAQFPEECYLRDFGAPGEAPGCPLAPGDAEPLLGFVVRTPTQVPGGLVRSRAALVVYTRLFPFVPMGGLPGGAGPVPVYDQEWTLPGFDVRDRSNTGSCSPYLKVNQRLADQAEVERMAPDGPWHGNIDLGNGQIIGGGWEMVRCGGSGSEEHEMTMLNWVDDGVFINVLAQGVDHETVLATVRSFTP